MSDPRKVYAFYYTWYGLPWGPSKKWDHWENKGCNPELIVNGKRLVAAPYYPLDGVYDSSDPLTINRQVRDALYAKLDGFVVSWWADEFNENWIIKRLLERVPADFRISVYYETGIHFKTLEKNRKKGIQDFYQNLCFLAGKFASHKRWIRYQGKPVIFLYWMEVFTQREIIEVLAKVKKKYNVLFVGCSGRYYKEHIPLFDGYHTYGPETASFEGFSMEQYIGTACEAAHAQGKFFVATISPGWDSRRIAETGWRYFARGAGTYYQTLWDILLRVKPDMVIIKSWNELGEGTNIEPSVEFGYDYLEMTAGNAAAYRTRPVKRTRIRMTGEKLERIYVEDDWRDIMEDTW